MTFDPLKWGPVIFWTEKSVLRRGLALAIFCRRADGSEWLAKPLEFTEVTNLLIEPHQYTVPANSDAQAFLQAALDHAWEIGMRPAGFNDTTQQVAAIKTHLEDMRALVFKQPKP